MEGFGIDSTMANFTPLISCGRLINQVLLPGLGQEELTATTEDKDGVRKDHCGPEHPAALDEPGLHRPHLQPRLLQVCGQVSKGPDQDGELQPAPERGKAGFSFKARGGPSKCCERLLLLRRGPLLIAWHDPHVIHTGPGGECARCHPRRGQLP